MPAGLHGAARPAPGTLSAHPIVSCFVLNQSLHSLLLSSKQKKVGPAGLVLSQKIFENFCEVLRMQNFQILNMRRLKLKHDYARWKENLCKAKLKYPICNANYGYVPRTSWRGLGF